MVVISLTLQNLQLFFSENTSVRSQFERFQIISKIFLLYIYIYIMYYIYINI